MKLSTFGRRFLLPRFVLSLYFALRYRAVVSPRAEVEWSAHLEFGAGSFVSSFAKVKATSGPVRIGSHVHIAAGSFVSAGTAGLEIGDDCLIGPSVAITGSNYRYGRVDLPIRLQGKSSKGIMIGRNVWIGSNASVLDGARIGDGAIITPNTTVSGCIPENAIVQGNPGKVIFIRR